MSAIWAHRGASAAERENTVAAFRAAVALGADGVELDVHRTADGLAAVVHDPVLPDGRLVSAVASGDLPADVPLLDAALDACGPLVVNVEIKSPPSLADVVVAMVRERGVADRVLVSSFDLRAIEAVRALDDAIPTAVLSMVADDLARCVPGGHVAFHPWDAVVDAALVAAAHDLGLAVNVWTVDDPERIRELAGWGVDAIVTNVPDVARTAISSRPGP